MCTLSSVAVGISETVDMELKCLRTWQASEMSPMGNDSLGTYFLIAQNNAADLAAGTSPVFVAVRNLF